MFICCFCFKLSDSPSNLSQNSCSRPAKKSKYVSGRDVPGGTGLYNHFEGAKALFSYEDL